MGAIYRVIVFITWVIGDGHAPSSAELFDRGFNSEVMLDNGFEPVASLTYA